MTVPEFEAFCMTLSEELELTLPAGSSLFDARLVEDLGFDSLLLFELLLVVEAWAEVVLPEALIPQLKTLGDVYNVFCTRFTQIRDHASGSRA